ncbi:MAG: glycosyltransferase, partial [Bacteroidetes bacterium]|nr:glycosyltransferase [Bacteroidota bacterium]
MSKKVGVILVNWNSFEFTNQCILSLKKCNQEIFDIIVVDNGSNDWSNHELKKSHSDVVLIQSETNTGFAGGNNLGIDYALKRDYTYIMLLNNDTFVEENFLTVLVDYMDQNSDVGIIQPKIFCHHNRKLLWNGGSYYYNWITLPYTKGY